MKLPTCLLSLIITLHICDGLKILTVFPLPGKSHSLLGEGICKHLLDAGHEVTLVTPFPPKKPVKNLHIVDVSEVAKFLEDRDDILNIRSVLDKKITMSDPKFLIDLMLTMHTTALRDKNMQNLLGDLNQQFDLAIIEWMFDEISVGVAAVLNCPYIWVSTIEPHWMALRLIDEPLNPAYNADAASESVPPFTFTQRVSELWSQVVATLFMNFFFSERVEQEYHEIFDHLAAKRGRTLPPLEDVKYNASLMLGNSHVSMGEATRLPQNYIPIGGYHIDSNVKPLPEDLQRIMDNAKNGVVYFSLGSNLKSKDLPDEIKKGILKMFSELKQTIFWKFEEKLPDLPSNVHILEWAPQHSILNHKNCVLFITHGGLLSTTETIHFGVPIVGIPIFADQFVNINRAVKRGIGKKVDLSYNMVEELKQAVNEVLNNPTYRERVKKLSLVYHDRPVSPGAELVHWVEHVARTRGAPHLRSSALHVPLYQKLYLDLLAIILVTICVLKIVVKRVFFSRKKVSTKSSVSVKKTN